MVTLKLIKQVNVLRVCQGNPLSKYFYYAKKSRVAYEHITAKNERTFRHTQCDLLVDKDTVKCKACNNR